MQANFKFSNTFRKDLKAVKEEMNIDFEKALKILAKYHELIRKRREIK